MRPRLPRCLSQLRLWSPRSRRRKPAPRRGAPAWTTNETEGPAHLFGMSRALCSIHHSPNAKDCAGIISKKSKESTMIEEEKKVISLEDYRRARRDDDDPMPP